MTHMIPLIVILVGVTASKIGTVLLGLHYEYPPLTAVLVAAPLIVIEVLLIRRISVHLKRYIFLEGTPFPFFALGVAIGIVLIGRGVI